MDYKVLFVTKERVNEYGYPIGLINSAKMTAESLRRIGIETKAVSVQDQNGIDKEVFNYKPTHCVIEALWVVPTKFKELIRLHPSVKWFVCVHSEIPFLANEGIAMEWIYRYQKEINDPRLRVAGNNRRLVNDLKSLGIDCAFMPNIYPIQNIGKADKYSSHRLDVGSFGAIRPLKNQLIQAIAAINYANKNHKFLKFHINAERTEQNGQSVLKNIRALFQNNPEHELVEYPWMTHEDFIQTLRYMDVGLQVSFTETFNIVTADYVATGIPVVVSNEINWMPFITYANTNSMKSIERAIGRVLQIDRFARIGTKINMIYLKLYNYRMQKAWMKTLREE